MSKRALAFYLIALAVPLLVGAGSADAQSPGQVLTLEQAIALALEHNHQIGVADAVIVQAEARTDEAEAGMYPRIDLWETFMRTTNPVYVFGNKLGQGSFTLEDFQLDALNSPDPYNNWNTRFSVTQPVWTGGRISRHVEAAELGHEAALAQRERTRQAVIHQAVEAFTGAVVADRHLRVAEEGLRTAQAHVALVETMRSAGLVVESDVLQARLRESEVEEMVIRAKTAIDIAHAALNMTMGRDLDTPFSLPETVDVPEVPDDDLHELIDEAMLSRPDLSAARSQMAAAGKMVDAARAEIWPTVGFSGSFEMNDKDFIGAEGTNWTLVGALQWSIFDGARSARVRQKTAEQLQAERSTKLLEQSISLQVREAFLERGAAAQRLEQARLSMDLAEENIRIVENRYREGLTTLIELLDAQTALTQARTRAIGAGRDLLLSQATLELAVGRK
jgi:outer membrane protein TolC